MRVSRPEAIATTSTLKKIETTSSPNEKLISNYSSSISPTKYTLLIKVKDIEANVRIGRNERENISL